MANTVHGPYAPTAWVNGSTPANQTNMNHLEGQNGVALASFNPDLIGAAYVSGVACVKDTTTASQLNVTSGKAYLLMTDGTNARIDVAATTFSASGHASSTMFLDLNPDGTWSFATTHSAQANFLPICQVTTDGSSNISAVADKRVTQVMLLANAALSSAGQPGGLALPSPVQPLLTQSALLSGTVNGSVTFGQLGALRGSMDGAALFNGSTGYVDVVTTSLPTGNAAWTLEGWFKTSASGVNGFLWDFGTNASKQGAQLFVTAANKLTGGFNGSQVLSGGTVNDGAWHHAAVTWDGTSITLYLDGAISAGPTAGLGPGNITAHTASIGQQESFGGNFFNGTLDECALYGTALSSTRILAHYNAGISTTTDAYATTVLADAPLRYHRLGDAVGATQAVDTIAPTASTLLDAGGALFGAAVLRLEGGSAVLRTFPRSAPLIVQINGQNFSMDASGNLTVPGALVSVGGQTSVGQFGAPVIVAQAFNVHVTAIGLTVILSFTPSVSGVYRANFNSYMGNSVSSSITAYVGYTSAVTSALATHNFDAEVNGTFVQLNAAGIGAHTHLHPFPITVYAAAGNTVQVLYNNTTATPADNISAFLERIS